MNSWWLLWNICLFGLIFTCPFMKSLQRKIKLQGQGYFILSQLWLSDIFLIKASFLLIIYHWANAAFKKTSKYTLNLTAENTGHPTDLMFVRVKSQYTNKVGQVTGGKMGLAQGPCLRCISLSSATTAMFPEIPFPNKVTNPGFQQSLNFWTYCQFHFSSLPAQWACEHHKDCLGN